MDLIQTWFDDRYYGTLQFHSKHIDFDFDSRSQQCEKVKTPAPVI